MCTRFHYFIFFSVLRNYILLLSNGIINLITVEYNYITPNHFTFIHATIAALTSRSLFISLYLLAFLLLFIVYPVKCFATARGIVPIESDPARSAGGSVDDRGLWVARPRGCETAR